MILRLTCGSGRQGGGPGRGSFFFFAASLLQEAKRHHREQSVVVQAVPGAALEVVEAEFLFELLVRLFA